MSIEHVPSRRWLGLILARGGSKRLPGKNIRPLCSKPLIAWSIEAGLACPALDTVLVSTDAPEIAEVARSYGADVPFLRPAPLAGDRSTSADAAIHALDWLAQQRGQTYDAVMLLEPTSPLRTRQDLPAVVALLEQHWHQADAAVSVGQVQLEQPAVMKRLDAGGFLQPWLAGLASDAAASDSAALFPYGVAYAVKAEALRQHRSFYPPQVIGHPIQRWQNYEVDDEFDFLCVEAVMRHLGGRLP